MSRGGRVPGWVHVGARVVWGLAVVKGAVGMLEYTEELVILALYSWWTDWPMAGCIMGGCIAVIGAECMPYPGCTMPGCIAMP